MTMNCDTVDKLRYQQRSGSDTGVNSDCLCSESPHDVNYYFQCSKSHQWHLKLSCLLVCEGVIIERYHQEDIVYWWLNEVSTQCQLCHSTICLNRNQKSRKPLHQKSRKPLQTKQPADTASELTLLSYDTVGSATFLK